MRRLLPFLFAVLLPLQSALAVFDAACASGEAAAAVCVEAGRVQAVADDGDAPSRALHDFHPCHHVQAAIAAGPAASVPPPAPGFAPDHPGEAERSVPSSRPERPQWARAARV